VADASAEYPLRSPRPGRTEQAPNDWWTTSKEALWGAATGVMDEVAGNGLTGQMHGSVFLDASDGVVRSALLWNSQRTERQCEEIAQVVGAEHLIGIAGNPPSPGFQAPNVLWLRKEEPENYRQVARVLPPKVYVRLLSEPSRDPFGTSILAYRPPWTPAA